MRSLQGLGSLIIFFVTTCSILISLADPVVLGARDPAQPQLRNLPLAELPSDGVLKLEGPLPSVSKVWLKKASARTPLEFGFNTDATEVSIYFPKTDHAKPTGAELCFLITEKTTIHPDGVVVLSALDSQVVGTKAKLETHPGNHRIGFWGKASDYVQWDTAIPKGDYSVELVYSRASRTGTEVRISFDQQVLPHTLETTGSWYRYRTVPLGRVQIGEAETHHVEIRVTKIVNGGVMNLKALILTPVRAGQ